MNDKEFRKNMNVVKQGLMNEVLYNKHIILYGKHTNELKFDKHGRLVSNYNLIERNDIYGNQPRPTKQQLETKIKPKLSKWTKIYKHNPHLLRLRAATHGYVSFPDLVHADYKSYTLNHLNKAHLLTKSQYLNGAIAIRDDLGMKMFDGINNCEEVRVDGMTADEMSNAQKDCFKKHLKPVPKAGRYFNFQTQLKLGKALSHGAHDYFKTGHWNPGNDLNYINRACPAPKPRKHLTTTQRIAKHAQRPERKLGKMYSKHNGLITLLGLAFRMMAEDDEKIIHSRLLNSVSPYNLKRHVHDLLAAHGEKKLAHENPNPIPTKSSDKPRNKYWIPPKKRNRSRGFSKDDGGLDL